MRGTEDEESDDEKRKNGKNKGKYARKKDERKRRKVLFMFAMQVLISLRSAFPRKVKSLQTTFVQGNK